MAAAQTTLQLILKANNEATVAINEVHASLQGIANVQFAGLQAELGKLNQNITHLASAHQNAAHAAHAHENALGRVGEKLRDVGKLAAGLTLGAGLLAGVSSLEEFAKSTVEATQNAQKFQTQLTTLYHSSTEAGQAMEFLDKQAAQVGFPEDDIRRAAASFVSMGADITKAIPATENLAAALGKSVPETAQTIVQAMAGHFRGLQSVLHISQGDLVQFGAKLDSSGHIIASSVLPALERLAQSKYGQAAAAQSNTWAGATQRLHNVFGQLQERVGAQVLPHITNALAQVGNAVANHLPQIQRFADAIGRGIGRAIEIAIPIIKGFISGLQSVGAVVGPLVSHLLGLGASARTSGSHLAEVGRVLGIVVPLVIAATAAYKGLKLALDILHAGQEAVKLAQVALNFVMAANPIGLVVIAIAALVAGFILAYNKIKPFHDAVNVAFELLKEFWGWITGTLVPKIGDVGGAIKDALGGAFDWVKDRITSFIDTFTKALDFISKLPGVGQAIHGLRSVISAEEHIAGAAAGAVGGAVHAAGDVVGGATHRVVAHAQAVVAAQDHPATRVVHHVVHHEVHHRVSEAAGEVTSLPVRGAPRTDQTPAQQAAAARRTTTGTLGADEQRFSHLLALFRSGQISAAQFSQQTGADISAIGGLEHQLGRTDTTQRLRDEVAAALRTAQQHAERTAATTQRREAAQERHAVAQQRREERGTLDNARRIFGDDLASLGKTTQDYNRLLSDAKTVRQDEIRAGVARAVVEADYQRALAQISTHMRQRTRAGRETFAPRPQFGTLGHEVSYGEVAVAFGGTSRDPSSAIIAALHQQIQHLQDQVRRDDQIIGLLKAGGNTAERQLSALVDIRGGVLRPGPPSPSPTNAHAAVRSFGGSVPVVRG